MDDRPDIDIADPLERAKSRIDADAFAPVTLAELAATASLSPFHFSRAFAARFGASPVTYARDMRLQAAARCLAADADVSLIDLAFDCGFESQEGSPAPSSAPLAFRPAATAASPPASGRPRP
jgi:AraC family transcriptional regulator